MTVLLLGGGRRPDASVFGEHRLLGLDVLLEPGQPRPQQFHGLVGGQGAHHRAADEGSDPG
jgi:hypothetical protein